MNNFLFFIEHDIRTVFYCFIANHYSFHVRFDPYPQDLLKNDVLADASSAHAVHSTFPYLKNLSSKEYKYTSTVSTE